MTSLTARFCSILLTTLVASFAWSQDDLLLISGTLTDDANRAKLTGVAVVVYQDGVEYDRMLTDARADYAFELPLRHDYVFSYEMEGYGNKRIQVDASGVPLEDLKGGFNLDLDMTLFTLVEGFDTSILLDPYGKASFDSQRNTVAFDFAYTDRMKTRVENEFERVERMAEQLAQMKKDFDALMTRGQQFMIRSRWTEALETFTDALKLFPNDAQAIAKQAEAQAKVDAERSAASLEQDFRDALLAGDNHLKADRLADAREAYLRAKGLKPNAPEPTAGLAKVDARELELGERVAYENKLAAADKAYQQQRFDAAKEIYAEASAMQPGERYPRDQMAACQAAMDSMAADAAALAARAAEYESLIDLADKNYRSKNWRDALRQYEQASALIRTETYPQERAEKCRENLAAEEADSAADAREAAAAADAAAVQQRYDQAIQRADLAYEASNWLAAKTGYEEALQVKPGERYPVARLERVAKELTKLAEASLAEEAAKSAAAEEAARRQAAETASREAAAAQAAAEADREARAAAEAAADALADAARRAAEDEARRRAREAAAALEVREDDEAEAYYREALQSERRAKAMEVEREKNAASELRGQSEDRAADRISDSQRDLEELTEATLDIQAAGQRRHQREVSAVEMQRQLYIDQQQSFASRGAILTGERQKDVEETQERTSGMLSDHQHDYRNQMPAVEQEQLEQRSRESDWSRSAAEYRAVAHDDLRESGQEYARLGSDEMERLRATQADIDATVVAHAASNLNRSLQAEERRYESRQAVLALDQGSPADAEDYHLAEEDQDVVNGIQEQSYDIPNGLVIERTVRTGNHVRRFRKVVTKTGVYYFEEDQSITESTWRRETTVILD